MILRSIKKIKLASIILNLSKEEPNDYSFGYKVRKLINKYRDNGEVEEEEINKEKPKA
jgi:hypothetical protein